MKRISIFLISYILHLTSSLGQAGVWTWISGTNYGGGGVYGTQGIPSVNNNPASNYEMVEWKDKQGNFWVYGGTEPNYDVMWRFNPVSLEWTWMQGDGAINESPIYGTQGVPDPSNTPGDISNGSCTWVDTSGGLWLFGGYHQNLQINTTVLWRYDTGLNEWAWMSGNASQAGHHGIQGVPNSLNYPGGRDETASSWADSLNNLWLYGGDGFDDNDALGDLNDVMKYNISTNEWTWMKGSAYVNAPTVYGTKGVADTSNNPGARWTYTKWMDKQGNFWIFGGGGGDVVDGSHNDAWKYDPQINEWTWLAGPNTINDTGNYGTKCVFDSVNTPASRWEERSSATDYCGKFWMFGGFDTTFTQFSDLWQFDPQLLQWKLLTGTSAKSQGGNYGIKGVPALTNTPPARRGANAWWGNDNKFYLFGGRFGSATNNLNDVWVFAPDTSCVPICNKMVTRLLAGFNSSKSAVCENACINFIDQSYNATGWQWYFPGATPTSSTVQNPQNICYAVSGFYDVMQVVYDSIASDTLLLHGYVVVNAPSVAQVVPADTALCPGSSVKLVTNHDQSFDWQYAWIPGSGLNTTGVEAPRATPTVTTTYTVTVTDHNGCTSSATATVIIDQPAIQITPDTSLCMGSSIQLLASGGVNYMWSPTAGLSDSAIANPIATSGITTEYTVQVTDSNLCSGSDSVTIIVNQLPVVSLNIADTVLCYGSSIQLIVSGGTSYSWLPTTGLSDSTISNPVATALQTTTYTVNVTDSNNCKANKVITLSIYPKEPTVSIKQVGHILYCSTDTAYISYQWYDDSVLVANATDTFYVATHNGNYNVEVTDKYGCKSSAGINVDFTGIGEVKENGVSVYPNPVENQFTIYNAQFTINNAQFTIKEIEIYNVLGAKVQTSMLQLPTSILVDVSKLSPGVYIVRLTQGNHIYNSKFVKE